MKTYNPDRTWAQAEAASSERRQRCGTAAVDPSLIQK
jgi:hypothetical protein